MIKPEFKKSLNRNYMVVVPTEERRDYQLKMVCANEIMGYLGTEIHEMNGEEQIFYDITSKQPFSIFYGQKDITYDALRKIFHSLGILYSESERFLLDPSNCVFDPEYVFCDPENGDVSWAFIPGGTVEGMLPFAEYIMEHTDHSDSRAVESAFRFFKCAKNDFFNPEEMIDFVERMGETTDKKPIYPDYDDYFPAGLLTHSGEIDNSNAFETKADSDDSQATESGDKKGKIRNLLNRIVRKKGETNDSVGISEYSNEKDNIDFIGFEEEPAYSCETMLLSEGHSDNRMLKGVRRNCEDIPLSNLPVLIGKMSDRVDVVLPGNTVSRVHAQIFESEGKVFLKDLNSRNGTYKNGVELTVNEIVEIKPGDEVCFADLPYMFV